MAVLEVIKQHNHLFLDCWGVFMCDTQTFKRGLVSARRCQLSQGDLDTLVSYIKRKADSARQRGTKRGIIDELLVLLMVHTGARASELCELKVGDLTISEEGASSIKISGSFPRRLPIPSDLFEKFQKYITLYRETKDTSAPLLVSEQGNHISYQSIYLKIKSIGKKAGLDALYPYMIRHFFLCRLYEKEHDLKLIQIIGGYQDPKTAAMSLDLVI